MRNIVLSIRRVIKQGILFYSLLGVFANAATLTVQSTPTSGVPITTLPSSAGGTTNYTVSGLSGAVSLTAPATFNGKNFVKWTIVGDPDDYFSRYLQIAMFQSWTVIAVYQSESKPTISINDVTQNEGNGGETNNFDFTVELSNSYSSPVTIEYTCNDNTATAPSDYITQHNTLTFNAGEIKKTISIPVVRDGGWEPDETYEVLLYNAVNASISRNKGIGTIVNDDPRDGIVTFSGTIRYYDGGTDTHTYKPARFVQVQVIDSNQNVVPDTLTETNASGNYRIDFHAYNGAQYGIQVLAKSDEGEVRNLLKIPHGLNGSRIPVVVGSIYAIDIDIDEDNRAGAWNLLDSLIRCRDFLVGGGYLTAGQLDHLVVNWDFGYEDGPWYNNGSNEISIADGFEWEDSVLFHEYGHYVEDMAGFAIDSPGGSHNILYKIGDQRPALSQYNRDALCLSEGWASFFGSTILYINGTSDGIYVWINDAFGQRPTDILILKPESGQAWYKGNTLTQLATYEDVTTSESELAVWGVLWDLFDLDDEEILSDDPIWADSIISNPPGKPSGWATDPYSIVGSWKIIWDVLTESKATTIGEFWDAWSNSDINTSSWTTRSEHLEEAQRVFVSRDIPAPDPIDPPSISIEDLRQNEGNDGWTIFNFTVNLSHKYNKPVKVGFTCNDDTAIAPEDYESVIGELSFDPGEISKTISVRVVGDTIAEQDEQFYVLLYNAMTATISRNKGVGIIVNDDSFDSSDLDGDGDTDSEDLILLAENWLSNGCLKDNTWCNGADVDRDGRVDLSDMLPISQNWPGGIDLVLIPAGTFQMGDSIGDGTSDERPVHMVTLDSFDIGKFEITNGQYCAFLKSAYPSQLKEVDGVVYASGDTANSYPYCDTSTSSSYSQIAFSNNIFSVRTKGGKDMTNYPMVQVSWYGAVAYCNWRSQQEGKQLCYDLTTWNCDFSKKGYRLPSEAEWEYAARGGLPGKRFPWGDTISQTQANYYSNHHHPLWNDGTYPYTSPVGFFDGTMKYKTDYNWAGSAESYQTASGANAYGLYDMAGNVWEWCYDWYGSFSADSQTNPTGPESGSHRIVRGGSFGGGAHTSRLTDRYYGCIPFYRGDGAGGFRVVLKP